MQFTLILIIAHTHGKEKRFEELKTLNIVTRLLENAAFFRIHVVERFSKDFSEVRGLRSQWFQLQVVSECFKTRATHFPI